MNFFFLIFIAVIFKSESFKLIEKVSEISSVSDQHLIEKRQIIYPGTKWCGDGNTAKSNDDLGIREGLDSCCRTHDSCPEVILAKGTNYNLTNPSSFTRLSCDCDNKLYDCLKKIDNIDSTIVGIIYFNIVGTQCFKKEYPIRRCAKYIWFKCSEYEFNTSQDKVYNFFDVPFY